MNGKSTPVRKVEVCFVDYTGHGTATIFENVKVLIDDNILIVEPNFKLGSTVTHIQYNTETTETTTPWSKDHDLMVFPMTNIMHIYITEYATSRMQLN